MKTTDKHSNWWYSNNRYTVEGPLVETRSDINDHWAVNLTVSHKTPLDLTVMGKNNSKLHIIRDVCQPYRLNQYFLLEFLTNFFGCHYLMLTNQDWTGYSRWSNVLHGCYRCLFVGLDLKIKLLVFGYLVMLLQGKLCKCQFTVILRMNPDRLHTPCMSNRNSVVLQIVPAALGNPVSLLTGIESMNSVRAFLAFPISIVMMWCGRRKDGSWAAPRTVTVHDRMCYGNLTVTVEP